MSQDHICTPFELKQFAFSFSGDDPTVSNLSRFIQSRSKFKYTLIEIEFLRDTLKTLEELSRASAELSKNFKEKWEDLEIPMSIRMRLESDHE